MSTREEDLNILDVVLPNPNPLARLAYLDQYVFGPVLDDIDSGVTSSNSLILGYLKSCIAN